MKDICAVSTPLAEGGISVIRISGDNAVCIAEKVFKPLSCKSVENMAGYTCAYGKIVDKNGREVDDGVLTVFRAPKSYTGENVCEISCHGGIYVTKKVLRLCIEQGAELAQRGEFTKRAFLNGKLSLTQAEGVMETISAQGEYALNSANLTKEGRLFRLISDMSRKFVTILGELAAWVDYPEEDLPEISEDNLRESLKNALAGLDKIIADHDSGMILKNGVDTVIAGKPNVGKSTLMNMLLGYDRSIVTNVAGTTRDVIEESAKLGELILKLSDTAGIRETEDIIEGAGIEKAVKKLSSADLIIAVFDNSIPLDDDDKSLIRACKNASAKKIACINKSDCEGVLDRQEVFNNFDNVVEISAAKGEGTDKLQEVLYDLFITDSNVCEELSVNERQKQCLDKAISCISEALDAVKGGITLDAVNIVLDEAENALTELTGERTTESVVNEVFSHFCVGK